MKYLAFHSLVLVAAFFLAASTVIAKSPIRKIDFRNFTYPGIWENRSFTLKDGALEILGKPCPNFNFTLEDVTYRDLDGDGAEDALVTVRDFTAAALLPFTRIFISTAPKTVASGCSGHSLAERRVRLA